MTVRLLLASTLLLPLLASADDLDARLAAIAKKHAGVELPAIGGGQPLAEVGASVVLVLAADGTMTAHTVDLAATRAPSAFRRDRGGQRIEVKIDAENKVAIGAVPMADEATLGRRVVEAAEQITTNVMLQPDAAATMARVLPVIELIRRRLAEAKDPRSILLSATSAAKTSPLAWAPVVGKLAPASDRSLLLVIDKRVRYATFARLLVEVVTRRISRIAVVGKQGDALRAVALDIPVDRGIERVQPRRRGR